MFVVCLDLEGVLVPEIWINVAEKTGIEKLRLTTRDIPDYDVLMKGRIEILKEHGLTLKDIQDVIATMKPLDGAKAFMDELRSFTQAVILSDTFDQFAQPLMKQLNWPTIFCNTLIVDDKNMITGYKLRQKDGKKHAVEGFHSMNLKVFASGDSYNDLSMIKEAEGGMLFCPPQRIIDENPAIGVAHNYDELLAGIRKTIAEQSCKNL